MRRARLRDGARACRRPRDALKLCQGAVKADEHVKGCKKTHVMVAVPRPQATFTFCSRRGRGTPPLMSRVHQHAIRPDARTPSVSVWRYQHPCLSPSPRAARLRVSTIGGIGELAVG